MKREEIKKELREGGGTLGANLYSPSPIIDWLYDIGYEVIKMKVTIESESTLEINPKSKFMEEWEEIDRTVPLDPPNRSDMNRIIELIDKYKEDK